MTTIGKHLPIKVRLVILTELTLRGFLTTLVPDEVFQLGHTHLF